MFTVGWVVEQAGDRAAQRRARAPDAEAAARARADGGRRSAGRTREQGGAALFAGRRSETRESQSAAAGHSSPALTVAAWRSGWRCHAGHDAGDGRTHALIGNDVLEGHRRSRLFGARLRGRGRPQLPPAARTRGAGGRGGRRSRGCARDYAALLDRHREIGGRKKKNRAPPTRSTAAAAPTALVGCNVRHLPDVPPSSAGSAPDLTIDIARISNFILSTCTLLSELLPPQCRTRRALPIAFDARTLGGQGAGDERALPRTPHPLAARARSTSARCSTSTWKTAAGIR